MRRIPAIAATLGLTALALVGCSAAPGTSGAACERPDGASTALDLVSVDGSDVTVTAPVYTDQTVVSDLEVGDGLAVSSPAQDVMFDITILDGVTGETLISSGTQVASVDAWTQTFPGMETALSCATEGSQILVAMAPDDIVPEVATNLGLGEDAAAVMLIDLQKVYLSRADGDPQFNDRRGMPTVVLAPDGTPGVIIPDAAAPDELVVQVLKKGNGPEIAADDTVRVNYTGVLWDDREVFDSSWESGQSAAFALDQVVPGFAAALEGQTVGSQILAVIPPDQGYGDQANGSIPANSTLVFVIDILGIDDAE